MEAASSPASASSPHVLTNFTSFPTKTLIKPPSYNPISSFKIRASKPSSPSLTKRPRRRLPLPQIFPKKRRPPSNEEESDAFPLSFPSHTKNPHAICKEIQRLARKGEIKEALTLLDYVNQQRFPVNATTFSTLIGACVRFKALAEGRQIHSYIMINGLERNEFLRTKLVHMYTSCGSIEDANRVFDALHCKISVYPWNAILRGNVVMGKRQYQNVLSTFLQMRELGIELNVYTFSCMLKSFAGASAFRQGLKIHALLIKNGMISSSILQTSLIDVYFKCGKIKLARKMFDEIPERDVVVWGVMIAGFAHNGLQREALDYLRQMGREGIPPNSVVLTTILPVVGEVPAHKLGREVHAYVLKMRTYLVQPFIQSGLIDMYCKCGDMSLGRRVFYASRKRSVVSWTALMSGYASNGKLDLALRSIVWMQQEGFKPDVVTVATVLPVCAKLRALKQGKEIHGYVLRNGFLPNVSIVTSMMVMYSKCNILKYSLNLFDDMEAKNVISWTAMVGSYVGNGQINEALSVFRLMLSSKHRPDSVATARMLSVCGQLRALKLGREIHGHVLKENFERIPFVSAEIVKMYGMCRATDKAKVAFDAIPIKGSLTWTAIIEAYGYNEQYQGAMDLFLEMNSNGFTPNCYTFEVALSLCLRAGLADEACQIFNSMTQRHGIKASDRHYSSIIELLDHVGRFKEAQRYTRMRSSAS